MNHTIIITPKLDLLLKQGTPRSKFWLLDTVVNKANGASDDISESADDFVSENGPGSQHLANAILVELGEEEIFAV